MSKINYSNVKFDGFKANNYDFLLYIGIKLDPQVIYEKRLSNSICKGVEFIGTFDNEGANFAGSKGAKINPQTIWNKDMENCVFTDVEFIGPFDEVSISGSDFTGSNYNEIMNYRENFRQKVRAIIYSRKTIE